MKARIVKLNEQDSALRYVGLAYAEHLTDHDLLGLAEERGLTVGVLGAQAVRAAQSWLGDQYEANDAALRDLGFKADGEKFGEAPSFDDVMQNFGLPALIRFDRRRQKGFHDNLVIYPSIRQVGLRGTGEEPGYVPRFDRKQGRSAKTSVLEVWGNFGDKDAVHDPHAPEEGWVMAMVLDSGSDLAAAEQTFGNPGIPRGLLYTGMDVHDQRALLATDHEDNDLGEHLVLGSVTLPMLVLINAQRRLKGQALLDDIEVSFARLPHYDDVGINGIDRTLSVGTSNGQIHLSESESGKALPAGGIREAVLFVGVPDEESDASGEMVSDEAG